jgi:hypothetical protein
MSESSSKEEKEKLVEEEDEDDELPIWDKKKSFGEPEIKNKIIVKCNKDTFKTKGCLAITKKPCKKFAIKFIEISQYGLVGFIKIPFTKDNFYNKCGNF